MQLKIIIGPWTDETKKFEVLPGQTEIDIGETFTRDSYFYKDTKTDTYQEKFCKIELGYFDLDKKWNKAGHVQLDMGKYVNKENTVLRLPFEGQTVTNNAEIHLSSTIIVLDPKVKLSE